jgi:CRISPR-associated protein Cmr6
MALPLPRATAEVIEDFGRRPAPDDGNVGLWLDKLVHRQRRGWKLQAEHRKLALEALCQPWTSKAGEAALARLGESVAELHGEGAHEAFTGKLVGRLLCDYGRAKATEASVSFHPIWGVPRIPGSALKGITRAQMVAEGAAAADVEALLGPAPEREDRARRGRVVFYDALPVEGRFELALDVLTPHHRSYYDGKGPPVEWEDPVPHTFVTVVKASFRFHVGVLAGDEGRGPRADLAAAVGALQRALEEAGVGAKTGAGYGRFEVKG